MEFPNYMCEGSKGPHIVVLGAFLAGKIFPPSDFVPDQDYGPNIKGMVSAYQIINGVTFENGCGPKTLAMMKKDCFDFEIACRHVIFEPALFVQPDGGQVWWSPLEKHQPLPRDWKPPFVIREKKD